MLDRHTFNGVTWVNLGTPTQEEVRALLDEFSIRTHIAQELLAPTTRPKIDLHNDQAYIILHFPAGEEKSSLEVDFVITKDALITTHYDTVPALKTFAENLSVQATLEEKAMHENPSSLFFDLLRNLYHSTEENLDDIEASLEDIEDQIFKGSEREMVKELSYAGRRIVDVKQITEHQRDVLETLAADGGVFFHDSFSSHLTDISEKHAHIRRRIGINQEFLQELRTTNDSLLTSKQNRVMEVLTIMAFSTLPATLVATIFGMNVISTPFAQNPNGFWIILGIVVVLTGLTFGLFRHKKWL